MADELVAAGAFHSVPKPLQLGELKQSLGFVWEAWLRRGRRADLRGGPDRKPAFIEQQAVRLPRVAAAAN